MYVFTYTIHIYNTPISRVYRYEIGSVSAILRDIYGKFKRNSSTTTITTATNCSSSNTTTTPTITHINTTTSTSGRGSADKNNRGSSRGGMEMYTMLCVNDDNELDDEDMRV